MNNLEAQKIFTEDCLKTIPRVQIGGVPTSCLSRKELTDLMVKDCLKRREKHRPPALVFDNNGQGISLAATSLQFREDLSKADIIHADGTAIVIAAGRLTEGRIADRSATTDFFHDAAKAATEKGLSFFLLGGTEEVNAKCADILKGTYPELKIVGRRNGYFPPDEEESVCREISASKPDIVWVGLGKPKEQHFCAKNQDKIHAGWLITCGGCYNYVTGDYRRAPMWMQRIGLEWLHRMMTNPRKFFWRYLTTTPHALYLIATRTKRKQL